MSINIENKRVLVTGGAGFIGSNLCEKLIAQNNEVICLDNLSTGNRSNIEPLIAQANFQFIEGDIRNIDTCRKAVASCDYVLHQAALGSVPRSIKDPMTTNAVNIGGFVNMLFAASEAGVKRFVYAASSSTYGDHEQLPKREDIIGNPLSPYAITKYANELYAKNFSEVYDIETVGLRYFNVFGRRQDPNGAYAAVIPKFVMTLMNVQSPVINGDGSHSRDFTYIDNVIQANELAAATPTEIIRQNQSKYYSSINKLYEDKAFFSEVINVAHGERTSLTELANSLKKLLSDFDTKIASLEIKHGPNRAGDIPHSHASIEKAKTIFNYTPSFNFQQGLQEAVNWYWNHLKEPIAKSN